MSSFKWEAYYLVPQYSRALPGWLKHFGMHLSSCVSSLHTLCIHHLLAPAASHLSLLLSCLCACRGEKGGGGGRAHALFLSYHLFISFSFSPFCLSL